MSQLLIAPAQGVFPKGQSFNFDLFVDGADLINAATVDLTWPAPRLKLTGTNFNGSALGLPLELVIEDGHCRISRAILPTGAGAPPITGRQFIGTLIFLVLDGGGARIKFSAACQVLRDGDAQNVLTQKNDGSYVLSPTTRANLTESVQDVAAAFDAFKVAKGA